MFCYFSVLRVRKIQLSKQQQKKPKIKTFKCYQGIATQENLNTQTGNSHVPIYIKEENKNFITLCPAPTPHLQKYTNTARTLFRVTQRQGVTHHTRTDFAATLPVSTILPNSAIDPTWPLTVTLLHSCQAGLWGSQLEIRGQICCEVCGASKRNIKMHALCAYHHVITTCISC